VSVATVERHVRSGAIPSFKVGSCRRFRRSEVIRAGEVIHANS
jgi:excisionase family DNA binding protein